MSDLDSSLARATEQSRQQDALDWLTSQPDGEWGATRAMKALPQPTEPKKDPGLAGKVWSGVSRGILRINSELSGVGSMVGSAIKGVPGLGGVGEGIQQAADYATKYWTDLSQKAYPRYDDRRVEFDPATWDPLASPGWWVEGLAEQVPALASYIIPSMSMSKYVSVAGKAMPLTDELANKLLWIGSKIVTPATAGLLSTGSTWNTMKQRGATDQQAMDAATKMGMVSAALMGINFHYLMGAGGKLAERAAKGATSNALFTFLQTGGEAAVLGDDVIQRLKESLGDIAQAAVVGAGVSAVAGGEPAKPKEPAVEPKKGPIPPTPEQAAQIERLKQGFASRTAETGTPMPSETVDRLAFLIADGKKVTASARTQAQEIIAKNPQASEPDLIREALGGIPEAQAKPTAEAPPQAKPATGQDIGQDSKLSGTKVQIGQEDLYVIREMQASAEMAQGEPLSGTRKPVPAGEEVSSQEVSGGQRWIGGKTLKPDWMKDDKGNYYSSEEVLAVIQKLKEGKWPTSSRQDRIASQIEWALREDASEEKARATGAGAPEAGETPQTERVVNEQQVKTGFFADVERLAQEEATAQAKQPLSDWQQSMLDMANEAKTAPQEPQAAPGAAPKTEEAPTPTIPGFKNIPGGPEGSIGKAITSLLANEDFEAGRLEQKRGKRGHDTTQAAADALRKSKAVTLADILSWQPGTIKNAEQARAGVDIAEAAVRHANALRVLAEKGERDHGEALSAWSIAQVATRNVSAVASELGRGLEAMKMEGRPAGLEATQEFMGAFPMMGGVDLANELTKRIEATAGSAKLAMDQITGLENKAARDRLGTLWQRTGRAGMELFFASMLSAKTAAKIVISGPITAAYELAVTGTAEGGRRLLNAIAPDKVDMVSGMTRGTTWSKWNGMLQGISDGWQGIAETWKAAARIAKAEGVVKGEQQFIDVLRQKNPEWSTATKKWSLGPKITGENFPEASEVFQKWLDVAGAIARYTTDGVSAAHAFGFTVNDRMGTAAAAHEIATREGLTGDAYAGRVRQLLNDRPPEIDQAGMDTAKHNTFIGDLHGPLGRLSAVASNAMLKLSVAPFTKIPFGILQYGLEGLPVIQNVTQGWREDFSAGGSRRDMALAKMAVGWAGLTALAAAAANGHMTGSPPSDRNERAAGEAAGVQWNSFNLGGQWTSYRGLEPYSTWFGVSADMVRILRDVPEANAVHYLGALILAAGEDFMNKPFMQGLARWRDVFEAKNMNEALKQMAVQLAPPVPMQSTIASLSPYADDVRREARSWTDKYLRLVPGNGLPARRNMITGEVLHYEGAWGPDFLSPFATHTQSENPVLRELVRLRGAGLAPLPDHMGGPRPPEYVDVQVPGQVPGVQLTPEQRDRWIVLMTQKPQGGQTLEARMRGLIGSAQYQGQSDVTKTAQLQQVYHQYRQTAQQALVGEDKGLRLALGMQYEARQAQRMPVAMRAGQPRLTIQ